MQDEQPMDAERSRSLVLAFLDSWRLRDLDRIVSFFSEESVYHNVPVAPLSGLEAIRGIFEGFLAEFQSAALDVVTVVAEPGLVLAERIDRFVTTDGRQVHLPVTGVFEVRGGKIVRFSDYFDLASFESQSGMKL